MSLCTSASRTVVLSSSLPILNALPSQACLAQSRFTSAETKLEEVETQQRPDIVHRALQRICMNLFKLVGGPLQAPG